MAIGTIATTIDADTMTAEVIALANVGSRIAAGSKNSVAVNGSANIGAVVMTGAMAGTGIEIVGTAATAINAR